MLVKDKLHKLIDEVNDEELLKSYLHMMSNAVAREPGELYKKLSQSEKEHLLNAYNDSFNADKLIPNDEMKKHHTKWLKK